MKKATFLLLVTALAATAAFGARRAGDSIGNAKSLGASQTATLVDEWDPEEKENLDFGICYYKKSLTRGQTYTIWIEGGSAASIDLDVYTNPNYYEDRDDEPMASFDVIDIDGGSTKVAYLYADEWDSEDPATGNFIVELSGDIGASTTLRFQKGFVSFTRTGSEDSPKSITMANSWKSFSDTAIEGGYFVRSALKAGRKYRVQTRQGTAAKPLDIMTDPSEPDDNGVETVVEDKALSTAANGAWVITPPKNATYLFYVSAADDNQKFTFRYTAVPTRSIAAHPALPLVAENDYEAKFVPGRISNSQDYYDAIIDEHLCKIYMAKDERWVFETTGAATNQQMRAYDTGGALLASNDSKGDGSFDSRIVVTAKKAGLHYVGVCNPNLGVYDDPTGAEITLTARRAADMPEPDENDPLDDTAAGASAMAAWPATTNDTPVEATSDNLEAALELGSVHAAHRLAANDHEDHFSFIARAGHTYALRASFLDPDELTSLGLAARVFTLTSSGGESKLATTNDITVDALKFKAKTSAVHYIRTWVAEGKGLDYPYYNLHLIAMDGTNALGLLKVDLAGAAGTWSLNKETAKYPAGATLPLSQAASVTVNFSAVAGFVTPPSETVAIPAWTPGTAPVVVSARYTDVYDAPRTVTTTKTVKGKKTKTTVTYPADDTPAGAVAITPAVAEAAARRTLWKGDAADHFMFTAAAGVYYSFALSGDENARLVVSNAVEGVVADAVSADGRDVEKKLLPAGATYVIVVPADPEAEGGAYALAYKKAAPGIVRFTNAKAAATTTFTVKEGAEYATLYVARTGTEGAVRARYATQAGTAQPGVNYYPVTDGVVSWAAGDKAAKAIKIRMIPDETAHWAASNLTFCVRLFPVDEYDLAAGEYLARTNAAAEATVVRVEAGAKKPGTISLTAYGDGGEDDEAVANVKKPVVTGIAGNDAFTLTFSRVGGVDGKVSVKVSTATAKGDTAKAGADYVAKTETLTWEDGDGDPKTVELELNEVAGYTASKKFTLNMAVVKTGTTPALSAKTATVTIKNVVVDQTAAAYAKTIAASTGLKLASTGTWFNDYEGNFRSAPGAGTVTYTLTGPGFFLCEPYVATASDDELDDGEESSARLVCQFNKEAAIDCSDTNFNGKIARVIPSGTTTVKFTLSNVQGGAYAGFEPQADGKPYLWVPFSKVAPVDPLAKAVVPTNHPGLAWSVPDELVDQDGLYCRVRFGTAAKPTAVLTNDLIGAGFAAFTNSLEAGKTYYWALDYAYTAETNLTAEQVAALPYRAGAATWSFSALKANAPVTAVLDGTDASGANVADLLAGGEPVELLQGVRPDFTLGDDNDDTNRLDATNFRLVGGALPKGLSISATTGALTGVPTAAGEWTALLQSYNDAVVKTTKKVNGKNKTTTSHTYTYGSTLAVTFRVVPAGTSIGTFRGTLKEDGETFVNDSRHLGSLALSVTSAGKMTAKATISGATYTFTGTGYKEVLSYDETAEGVTRQLMAELVNTTKINKVNYKNYLTLYIGDGVSTNTIALSEKIGRAELDMNVPNAKKTAVTPDVSYTADLYRNNGGTAVGKAAMADFAGYYTVALAPRYVTSADGVPVGNGYLLMTVAAANTVKITGVLANGTSVSCTTFGQLIGDDLEDPRSCVLSIPVYAGSSAHAIGGVVEIAFEDPSADAALPVVRPSASLLWVKNAAAATSRDGGGFSIEQAPTGGWYDKVVNLQAHYLNGEFAVRGAEAGDDLPAEALASGYEFRTESTPQDLAMKFTGNAMTVAGRKLVTNKTYGLYDFIDGVATASVNPWSVTLKFTRATGVVTGTFSAWEWKFRTVDGYTYPTVQKEIKKLTHKGVMLFSRDSSSDSPLEPAALTAGFFLMPAANTKTIKWKASLPFNIITIDDSERSWDEIEFPKDAE